MRQALERTLDIGTALFVLAGLSPVWLILALAVWIDCRGPVLFGSERVGQNGKRFRLWRFRTIRVSPSAGGSAGFPDAPADPAAESEDRADVTSNAGISGQTDRSPRAPSRFGLFVRRFRLDEMPELLNVLAGQLTLIGPRAENPSFIRECGDDYKQVLSVKPGLTGCPGLTLFDEQRILTGARDRGRSYVRNVLPLKVAADLQFVRHPGLRSHTSALAIAGLQFMRLFAQVTPVGFRRVGKLGADALIVAAATLIKSTSRSP